MTKNLQIVPFDDEKSFGIPQASEMEIMGTANTLNEILDSRNRVSKARLSSLPLNDEDLVWIDLRHDLDRMGSNDYLAPLAFEVADEASLQISMHVYVWFVENESGSVSCSRKKPHSLQPHLETVSHLGDFPNKFFIPHMQEQRVTWKATAIVERHDL